MRLTLTERSKLFAAGVVLAVVWLLGGRANGQEAAPLPPAERMQTLAPAAGAPPPGGLTAAQYTPPPPQETPPPQDLPPTPQDVAPAQPVPAPPPTGGPPAGPFSPPTLVAAGGVPVRFIASDGGDYFVSVTGAFSGACRVPCTMSLAPGITTLKVSGSLNAASNVNIPNAPAVVQIGRGSAGIRATGGVLFIIGGIGGIYLTATDSDHLSAGQAQARLEIAIVDLVLVAVGGGMALFADKGGVQVRTDTSSRAGERTGGVRLAGVGAAPTRGGALLGAALQF